MDVLDGPDRETTGDLDLLTRMRTPGVLELVSAYERLTPEARNSLVSFLRTMTAQAPEAAAPHREVA